MMLETEVEQGLNNLKKYREKPIFREKLSSNVEKIF